MMSLIEEGEKKKALLLYFLISQYKVHIELANF